MKITSNQTQYTQQQTTKNNQSKDNSNEPKKDASQYKTFIEFLDDTAQEDWNKLNENDRKEFHNILEDNYISSDEVKGFTFEQARAFNELTFKNNGYSKVEDMGQIPIFHWDIGAMDRASAEAIFPSNNPELNEAVWKYNNFSNSPKADKEQTLSAIYDDIPRRFRNADFNYYKAITKDNEANVTYEFVTVEERRTMDLDYDLLLNDAINYMTSEIDNPKKHPVYKEQLKILRTGYKEIMGYYQDVKNKPKDPVYA